MKVKWDYTELAEAYLKRPDYSKKAVEKMLEISGVKKGDHVCDVGAGAAHLTKLLAENDLIIDAVEPNDAMRNNGKIITEMYDSVTWHDGVGENTGQESGKYKLVTFGSSFNVTDRALALIESDRILEKGGYFACMWNHRDLNDSIQIQIENAIKSRISDYDYGSRREDQTDIIDASGLFEEVQKIEGTVLHEQSIQDCLEGWKSHATLYRQAGDQFENIISDIEDILKSLNSEKIIIPYTTRIWIAKVKK